MNPRAILETAVQAIRASLDARRSAIEQFEAIHKKKGEGLESDEIAGLADDRVLDFIYQFGLCAELAYDGMQAVTHEAQGLRDWRDSTGCWSDEAEHVLAELERLATVFDHANKAFHRWADQLSDEYERRHPESADLPLRPLDLGPTNAARLPRVF